MVSKIVEFDNLCRKYLKKIEKTYPDTARIVTQEDGPVGRKVGANEWARRLRNKISFHFDQEHPHTGLNVVRSRSDFSFMAGPIRGVTVYNFAEEIVSISIFVEAGDGDLWKGVERARQLVTEVQSLIGSFTAEIIKRHFDQAGIFGHHETLELRERYCADPDEFELPLSVRLPAEGPA
jgi:hypothetical protein